MPKRGKIPLSPVLSIIKEEIGIQGIRISKEAKEEIKNKLIEFISLLAREMWRTAKSMKRRTIKKEDVEKAFKSLFSSRQI